VKLLLDTHVWLWWTAGSPRITADTRRLFDERANELLLSAASAWEIAIKYRLGRLPLPSGPAEYITSQLMLQSIRALDVTVAHAACTAELPLHHNDPFDRLLIAQARCEGLTLVTADRAIAAYAVAQLRV
jgi:PIN domain nuclease of toxin-antitoxin system